MLTVVSCLGSKHSALQSELSFYCRFFAQTVLVASWEAHSRSAACFCTSNFLKVSKLLNTHGSVSYCCSHITASHTRCQRVRRTAFSSIFFVLALTRWYFGKRQTKCKVYMSFWNFSENNGEAQSSVRLPLYGLEAGWGPNRRQRYWNNEEWCWICCFQGIICGFLL